MPPQIKRLLPLFAAFIGLFLLARHFLVPASFGEYGHYRGLSLEENKVLTPHFAGKAACAECHDDMSAIIVSDVHSGLSCETCHGPGLDHVNYADSVGIEKPSGREFCGLCHSMNPAKKKAVITTINLTDHYPGHDCIACHNPHKPTELKEP